VIVRISVAVFSKVHSQNSKPVEDPEELVKQDETCGEQAFAAKLAQAVNQGCQVQNVSRKSTQDER